MWVGDRDLKLCAAQLLAFAATLRRARWRLATWCAAFAAAALVNVVLIPAQFVATVDIALAPQTIANDGPEDVRHFHQIDLDSELAATELEILMSERLLGHVFDKLSLSESGELQRGADGFWATLSHVAHRLALAGPAYDARRRAYFAFVSRVRCLRLGLSYVFEISYRSHDPALAARVANAVAAQYLVDRISRERTRRVRMGEAYNVARSEALTRQWEIGSSAAAAGLAPGEDLPAAAARILGAAPPPLAKSYPKAVPTLALGAALGLLSGLLVTLTAADRTARR